MYCKFISSNIKFTRFENVHYRVLCSCNIAKRGDVEVSFGIDIKSFYSVF